MEQTLSETTGFIAALDQSGGSTPAALRRYGYDQHLCEDPDQMPGYFNDTYIHTIHLLEAKYERLLHQG